MTGYNHYSNCTCGWCVNYGGSRIDRSKLTDTFRYRDARLLLKQSGANSVSGCYVNSNARCPVCSAAVFFYANAAGSRVYFDDLGPPWPKHPCTDGPRGGSRNHFVDSFPAPTRRSRGQVKELLAAANTAGLSSVKIFGRRRPDDWSLVIIHSVDRQGENNRIEGEYLDSETGEPFRFDCRSKIPLFEVGDFVSVNGEHISFVDKETLRPVFFISGAFVEPSDQVPETPKVPSTANRAPAASKPAKLIRKPETTKRGVAKYDMTTAEMVHFDNKEVTLAELFGKLEPVIKLFAREGVRKPKEVALRLNAEGYRTAHGAKWTPRLVFFLLALLFNGTETDTRETQAIAKRPTRSPDQPRTSLPAISAENMNADTIAERLASLGRIVRKTTD